MNKKEIIFEERFRTLYMLPDEEIKDRIEKRKVNIAVIGLGRVGLPVASTLAGECFTVIGVDINRDIVTQINAGESLFADETGLTDLLKSAKNSLRATTDISEVEKCDLVIVIVPTLLKENKEPNIDAVYRVVEDIAPFSKGKVIVFESTVPPFTTNKVGEIIKKKTGLEPGKDFGLVYSPERVQSPQILRDLRTYPKIVGGIDEKSAFIISEIYSTFAPSIIKVSNPLVAEIVKITENVCRDANIAFANELAMVCKLYGVDVYEVIEATNPYFNILNPGLVGGHCIPMDPYYIIRDVEKKGYEPKLFKTARLLNEGMIDYIVNMADCERICILGLSFKQDIKAFEHSHSLKLIDALGNKKVVVHDPFLSDEKFSFKVEKDVYKAVEGSDCIILSTAHSAYKEIDLKKVKRLMRGDLVIDVRGFFEPEKIRKAGLTYKGLGR